ncbi:UvrD-helicase domain-containing protein [Pectobacterium aroidearum]|uniref:UvrD-helicase domain-containing protein n=1 Tax=Pectobacterium aroidearum TaxID=1201031 RepID=UPI0032F07A9F
MIEIQIAGAGAGKTFDLAKSLIAHIKNSSIHKKTFALTYTNTATSKIEQEVIKQYGYIPHNLCIQTVHSFLLNEVVYPFSSYTLGDMYNDASIMPVGDPKYKAGLFKRLREKNVIHAENVYNVSKQIVDETVSRHNTIAKRKKVKRLLSILENCFEKIFIDEVQDLDADALRFFEVLGSNGINIYMIGDPKQAIKYPHALDAFIDKVASVEYTTILEINNVTRRVPNEILAISNRFCFEGQCQISSSTVIGELFYLESTDENYDKHINSYIESKQIVCIDKKNGKYSTSSKHRYSFPYEIEVMIREINDKKDKTLFVKAAFSDFMNGVYDLGSQKAIKNLIAQYSLKLEKHHFAQLYSLCEKCAEDNVKFKVSSIESVKGLDSDTCVIILTTNTLRYLLKINLNKDDYFNKEWKKVYVALTRAKQRLVLALDHELLSSVDIEKIKNELETLGFKKYS